jgi:hypothetical protein
MVSRDSRQVCRNQYGLLDGSCWRCAFGAKVFDREYGSPDFVAVMLITPIGVLITSIVMWSLFFKSNPYRKAKRE